MYSIPSVIEPTYANDDHKEHFVGDDFNVVFLDSDQACQSVVSEVNLPGHNVPGSVVYKSSSKTFVVSGTKKTGNYSISYAIRGVCESLDTATVFIIQLAVVPLTPPQAPDVPICRAETRGDPLRGVIDIFNFDEFGFASSYNLYDINRELVAILFSNDFTLTHVIGPDVNTRNTPWVSSHEIEWNGAQYGFDQTSIFFGAAVENGVESEIGFRAVARL